MNLRTKISDWLSKPVSIAPLVTLRVIVGAMLVFSTVRFWALGWIEDHYVSPQFHFKYYGFEWVEPLPATGMYAVHALLIISSLCVMLGLFYRLAAVAQFLLFTYTELIDLTYYLNHYYFVSIACGLLIFVPANRAFSLDVWCRPGIFSAKIPRWAVFVFQLQLGIVYFYAGLWKINYDWLLNALPLKIWAPASDQLPLVGWLFKQKITPYLFSWIGMLYDVTIVLWLSWRRTRIWAYATVVIFHTLTGLMFQIGVFPLVMMGATLIFFSEKWHERLYAGVKTFFQKTGLIVKTTGEQIAQARPARLRSWQSGIIILFFLFQILFPWRYLLYPGNIFWTEEGYRFCWRVMLMEKAGTATFYVKDAQTGREGVVINSEFLNAHQEKQMAMQPDMILQFAHFLQKHYTQHGVNNPAVRAEVYVTLNARPGKLLLDPNVDLTKIRDGWSHKSWILPY